MYSNFRPSGAPPDYCTKEAKPAITYAQEITSFCADKPLRQRSGGEGIGLSTGELPEKHPR
jgi:hypothetical protein